MENKRVVVIGGGWAGCAAALAATKQGAKVLLLERTDMLLGTGLVGGIFRNNGRFTATEEAVAMGGGELFAAMDACALHRNIDFPGHKHASLYSSRDIEGRVVQVLQQHGVAIRTLTRITDVEMDGARIVAVMTGKNDGDEQRFEADAFVETTGTSGSPSMCNKHGNGCAMCVLRCHTFGMRVSIAGKAGVREINGRKGDQLGAMSGACEILKESMDPELVAELNRTGVLVVPIPQVQETDSKKLDIKCCQQYALPEYHANLVILDNGEAKLMTTHFPLQRLRTIPGFREARFADPYSGGIGNSMRYFNMSPRNDALKVDGLANLFCGGEKAGLLVGHTEAVVTGTLAGYNAARCAFGKQQLVLPDSLANGDAIKHVREQMQTERGLGYKYTFSGSVYFERMKQRGSYLTDVAEIRRRVDDAGLTDVFGWCSDASAIRNQGPLGTGTFVDNFADLKSSDWFDADQLLRVGISGACLSDTGSSSRK